MDTKIELSDYLLERMAELKLWGFMVPEEYGGTGVDIVKAVIATEELACADLGLTSSVASWVKQHSDMI